MSQLRLCLPHETATAELAENYGAWGKEELYAGYIKCQWAGQVEVKLPFDHQPDAMLLATC